MVAIAVVVVGVVPRMFSDICAGINPDVIFGIIMRVLLLLLLLRLVMMPAAAHACNRESG